MNIAVIDDSIDEARQLAGFISTYCSDTHTCQQTTIFNTAADFLRCWQRGSFDLIFIDIFLRNETSGIRIAERVRRDDDSCTIADEAGLGDGQDPWRILYEDEDGEDGDLGNQQSSVYMNVDENEYLQKLPETSAGESFQTVLLSEKPAQGEEVRRLSALNGSDEDIVISYYPFVIGKHKDLADYVLLKDTVSRFHIRLDEDNGNYTITDLNSTNGTRVRGSLLEANETTQLEPGDQIFIADCGYIFG